MSFLIIIQIVLLDLITLWGIKKTFPHFSARHRKSLRNAFIIQVAVSVLIVLIGHILQHQIRDYRLFASYYYLFGLVFIIYIPKSVYGFFLIADWLVSARPIRFFKPDRSRNLSTRPIRFFKPDRSRNLSVKPIRFIKPDRFRNSRHIVAKAGFWTSLFFVFLVIWGILFGRYHFTVEQVDVAIDDLPPAFHGYKIAQISDVHAGSFVGSIQHFQKAVDLINRQEPDLIVFTGDLVNNFAEEVTPLIPIFSQLVARDGKYAVLGNHDYGGYYNWNTPADSVANHNALKNAIEQMGFVILNNQSVVIDPILPSYGLTVLPSYGLALIGTENWGTHKRHPKYGDLEKAMEPVRDIPFKVLLSHNPLFWPEHVAGKTDIALTLSGHTHGMQMGVRLGEKRLCPATLFRRRYPYGVGLYQVGTQYLYVNRGLGVIGFPGRIGMPPEITVITLRNEK